jgi:hypothetical protein
MDAAWGFYPGPLEKKGRIVVLAPFVVPFLPWIFRQRLPTKWKPRGRMNKQLNMSFKDLFCAVLHAKRLIVAEYQSWKERDAKTCLRTRHFVFLGEIVTNVVWASMIAVFALISLTSTTLPVASAGSINMFQVQGIMRPQIVMSRDGCNNYCHIITPVPKSRVPLRITLRSFILPLQPFANSCQSWRQSTFWSRWIYYISCLGLGVRGNSAQKTIIQPQKIRFVCQTKAVKLKCMKQKIKRFRLIETLICMPLKVTFGDIYIEEIHTRFMDKHYLSTCVDIIKEKCETIMNGIQFPYLLTCLLMKVMWKRIRVLETITSEYRVSPNVSWEKKRK